MHLYQNYNIYKYTEISTDDVAFSDEKMTTLKNSYATD